MPFPYSQTQKIILERTSYQIDSFPHEFDLVLEKSILNKGVVKKDDWFVSTNSLFNIPYKFQVKSLEESKGLTIRYKVLLHNLVNGVLIINLLTAFFSKFQFETYLWFVLFASIIFYGLSLLIIRASLKSMTLGFFEGYRHENNLKYVNEKSEIKYHYKGEDQEYCPACNNIIQANDTICRSCGIKLKQNPYSKPLEL